MTFVLDAQLREHTGKKINSVRTSGFIPAVVYGNIKDNVNVQLESGAFKKVFSEAGESTLVDLKVDGKDPIKILIQDVQLDPVSHSILHADLFVINPKEKIKTEVELHFIGESKAVKELGGVLVKNHDTVEIECLPGDLVHSIDVALEKLGSFEDKITISDLPTPSGITFIDKPEIVVAFVSEPRSEKEMEELDSQIEEGTKEVEVEEKGKKEEAGEEGETAEEKPEDAAGKKENKKEAK